MLFCDFWVLGSGFGVVGPGACNILKHTDYTDIISCQLSVVKL